MTEGQPTGARFAKRLDRLSAPWPCGHGLKRLQHNFSKGFPLAIASVEEREMTSRQPGKWEWLCLLLDWVGLSPVRKCPKCGTWNDADVWHCAACKEVIIKQYLWQSIVLLPLCCLGGIPLACTVRQIYELRQGDLDAAETCSKVARAFVWIGLFGVVVLVLCILFGLSVGDTTTSS